MSLEQLLNFFLNWGIWIFVPLLLDGLTAFKYMIDAWRSPVLSAEARQPLGYLPRVTILIPFRNSAHSLPRCLASLAAQTYPLSHIHIVGLDNDSSDGSGRMLLDFQTTQDQLTVSLITLDRPGKATALNAGIHVADGEYVSNIDADTSLHPDAVYEMVRAFEEDPRILAATGAIEVETAEAGGVMATVRACERMEYLFAFRVGRIAQSEANTLYTLAGAFSFFRRDALLQSFMYDTTTVAEDMKLTFDLRQKAAGGVGRLICVPHARAIVEPIQSWAGLYAQRARWQRGQVEVSALFPEYNPMSFWETLKSFSGRILVADHTLAFPRLTWTFLLPFLFVLGYSLPLVASAMAAMYAAYFGIEILFCAALYRHLRHDERQLFWRDWWVIPLMPIYRYVVYWFRFAGILQTVTEPAQWRIQDPFTQVKEAASRLLSHVRR